MKTRGVVEAVEAVVAPTGTYSQSLTVSGIPVNVGGSTTDHDALNNLDFASAGHTGFGSAADTAALAASGVATDAAVAANTSLIITTSGHLQSEIAAVEDLDTVSAALVGADGITVISGSNITTVSGFQDEFLSASGTLVKKSGDTMTGDLVVQGAVSGTLLSAEDGAALTPSITFSGDNETGFHLQGPSDLRVTVNQADTFKFQSGHNVPVRPLKHFNAATVDNPTYSWINDIDTGVYQLVSGDNTYAFSTDGIAAGHFDGNQNLHVTNDLRAEGTVSGTDSIVDDTITAASGTYSKSLTVSGVPVRTVVDEFVLKTGDTMTGDLTLSNSQLFLDLNQSIVLGPIGNELFITNIGTSTELFTSVGDIILTPFDGNVTVSGAFFAAEENQGFSRIGAAPSHLNITDAADVLVTRKERAQGDTTGTRRGLTVVLDVNNDDGTLSNNATNFGLNAFVYTGENTSVGSNRIIATGSVVAGRYAFRHRGAGYFAMAGGVASNVALQIEQDGTVGSGYAYLDEGGAGGAGTGEITNYYGLWIKDSTGRVETKKGIWIEDLSNASGTNVGIQIDGSTTAALWFNNDSGTANDGITFGSVGDVTLYRSAADTLRTDDKFVADKITSASGIFADALTVSGIPVRIDTHGISNRKNISVESPTSSEDIPWFSTDVDITVSEMVAVVGGSSPSVTLSGILHDSDRSAVGNNVLTSGVVVTSETIGHNPPLDGDVTIPGGSFVWLETQAQSGTVENLLVSITYTED